MTRSMLHTVKAHSTMPHSNGPNFEGEGQSALELLQWRASLVYSSTHSGDAVVTGKPLVGGLLQRMASLVNSSMHSSNISQMLLGSLMGFSVLS